MNRKHRIIMRRLALGIAASTAITATAQARSPWIDTGALDEHMRAQEPARRAGDAADDADMVDPVANNPALLEQLQVRMERHRRQLLPEYQRRRTRDGPASADVWLQREASERGEREAKALQRDAARKAVP